MQGQEDAQHRATEDVTVARLVLGPWLEMVAEGEMVAVELETFLKVHSVRLDEGMDEVEFLYFCRDWFRTRGFVSRIEPRQDLNWFQRKFLLLLLGAEG